MPYVLSTAPFPLKLRSVALIICPLDSSPFSFVYIYIILCFYKMSIVFYKFILFFYIFSLHMLYIGNPQKHQKRRHPQTADIFRLTLRNVIKRMSVNIYNIPFLYAFLLQKLIHPGLSQGTFKIHTRLIVIKVD